MSYAAKVLADSLSPDGVRLTTLEVTLPRIVLAEFNTHRMLSRNSASSRAIPIPKRIQSVLDDPYVPDEFGSHKVGMQSGDPLEGKEAEDAEDAWLTARDDAVRAARRLAELEVHKEYANRLLEPFLWHTIIATATEWENFFALRCHPLASRPIRVAAEMMQTARQDSVPKRLAAGDWHLPLVDDAEALRAGGFDPIKVSIGRSARVSYLTHEGKRDPAADVALYERLVTSGHMSPLEHVARPATRADSGLALMRVSDITSRSVYSSNGALVAMESSLPGPERLWFGNFRGWVQYRKLIPGEDVFRPAKSSP